jgi:regulator of sirC expression with transglutaminase-like and TPR domain
MIDPRTALDAIGQLPDAEIDIVDAALQFGRVDAPDADWEAARQKLSELARDAVAATAETPPNDLSAKAGALAGLIAGRHKYAGDIETYDDPANANLIRVTERKLGLPVAIGMLWLHAARAAGWNAHGVDFPGHFLIAVQGESEKIVLDVFAGGTPLDAKDLRALIKRVEGPKAELRPGVLAPMGTRDVLMRLQNNIKVRRLRENDLAGALACAQDMLRVAPEFSALWRETAVIHQRLDQVGAALRCFERFLKLVPDGEAATRARTAMEELRSRLN